MPCRDIPSPEWEGEVRIVVNKLWILLLSILFLCTACDDYPPDFQKGHYETRYMMVGKTLSPYRVWIPDEGE